MLKVEGLSSRYGAITAVRNVTLEAPPGQITGIIGLNGAGKSTLLKTIAGIQPAIEGRISLNGEEISALPIQQRAQLGLRLVPEGRHVFSNLTVFENLKAGLPVGATAKGDAFEEAYTLFPDLQRLQRQKAGSLSGGQQQMLAIARAMMGQPKVLLLDEPTMGLSPKLIEEVFALIRILAKDLDGVIVTGQEVAKITAAADRVYLMQHASLYPVDTTDVAVIQQQMMEFSSQ